MEDGKRRFRMRCGQPNTLQHSTTDAGGFWSMPDREAIILAGGLGTRLSSVVADRPKVMVDLGGRPFLEILLDRLSQSGIARVILATGHMHQYIANHFGSRWRDLELHYSVEKHALGTGGAVREALKLVTQREAFVLNGDTFFDVDLQLLHEFHRSMNADVTVALKPMQGFARYGAVDVKDGRITGFREKQKTDSGLINAGVYLMNRDVFERFVFPGKFSLETDFLEQKTCEMALCGFVRDGYFIDIGLPEDCIRARRELPPRSQA